MRISSLSKVCCLLSVLLFAIPQTTFAADAPWWQRDTSTKQTAQSVLSNTRIEAVPIPVLFGFEPADLPSNFGVPRSGGRTHEGLDIMAPRRALVVSPTQAVVHSFGDGASSGLYVYTYNPGGEVFAYMHLDEIAPRLEKGDLLSPGDLIGYVGNTGNASGGGTHLHFEIRDSVALDPYPRLTGSFFLQEEITFLNTILSRLDTANTDALSTVVAAYYATDMRQAQAMGLVLPSSIEAKLGAVTATDVVSAYQESSGTSGETVPTNTTQQTLPSGVDEQDVTQLQTFLIETNVGASAQALAKVGATGYYGSLTTAALAEYQSAVGLSTTSGAYDQKTQDYIAYVSGGVVGSTGVNTAPAIPVSTPQQSTTQTSVSLTDMPTQQLSAGAHGAAVTWLQAFLIAKHIGAKATALREITATGYFGSVTTAALAEYQAAVGISPAVGYYGPVTRDYIRTNG